MPTFFPAASTPSFLALAGFLAVAGATPAFAGDFLVTARGTVTDVSGGIPAAPFEGAAVGQAVEFSIEVDDAPFVNSATFWEYPTDGRSGGLTIGAAFLPVLPGAAGVVNLQNEPVDAVTLGAPLAEPFVTGVTVGLFDFSGLFLASPDIRQVIGQTMTSTFPGAAVLASSANTAIIQMEITSITFDQGTCPSLGVNSCSAETNSTGFTAETAACGSDTASANDVRLFAYRLPPQAFGFFLASQTSAFTPQPGGSSGNLCLGGAIGRYVGPGQIRQADSLGAFELGIDLTQMPTPGGFVVVQPGDTWFFSSWYRDSTVGGQATSNFSDRREVTFS